MKKKLSLLLAAVMVVTMLPMSAFATTKNRINKTVTVADDADITGVNLVIENDDNDLTGQAFTFELDLENAKFDEAAFEEGHDVTGALVDGVAATAGVITVKNRLDDTSVVIEVNNSIADGDIITIPLTTTADGVGEATVTIDPLNSAVTAGTYTFAIVAESGTKTTIDSTVDMGEEAKEIKSIVITEVTAGSIENDTLKLKLSSGFKFVDNNNLALTDATGTINNVAAAGFNVDDDTIEIAIAGVADGSPKSKLVISGIQIKEDDAKSGDIAEITVSGAGVSKETIEVAKFVEYGVAVTVEDETLPVFYSGTMTTDNETLEVTFEENVPGSWWTNRKTTFAFPDGVKVVAVDVTKADNIQGGANAVEAAFNNAIFDDNQELEVTGLDLTNAAKTAKIEMTFTLSVAPDFTGDVELTVGGAGISEDTTVTVATVVAPVTVTAETNEVSIDYRNVAISDIIITEAYAGALDKDKEFILSLENMSFESGVTYEVLEGDIKIDEVKRNGGNLTLIVKSESSKTPAKIKLSNLSLYLDRSLPAGGYNLRVSAGATGYRTDPADRGDITIADTATQYTEGDAVQFYNASANKSAADADGSPLFDTRIVTVVKDYVKVVTAGRDQDDSTFTTKITVTVGASEMTAGDKTIALDVPAYIANGYTMLPVRAVTEALSGSAVVRWDDETKTCLISFGSRIISMTVGSKVMNINGVDFNMNAAPEITNDRIFIPLRDLGVALGLNDDKINWDDATKTATLN